MTRPFIDWNDPDWPCADCGCAQAEHETRVEQTGFGHQTQNHTVTECADCGACDEYCPLDGWAPDLYDTEPQEKIA